MLTPCTIPSSTEPKQRSKSGKKRDPIANLVSSLKQHDAFSDAVLDHIERDVAKELDDAVAYAEAGTWEPLADLERFVYSERRPA